MPTISPGQTATLTLVNFAPAAELFINYNASGTDAYSNVVSGGAFCPQTVGGWSIANFVYNSGAGTATLDVTVPTNAPGGNYEIEYGDSTSGNVRGGATFTVPGTGGGGDGGAGASSPTLTAALQPDAPLRVSLTLTLP